MYLSIFFSVCFLIYWFHAVSDSHYLYISACHSFFMLSIYLSFFQSVFLFVFISVCLSVCLFAYLSVCLYVCLSICMSIFLIYLFVYLSLYLRVFLWFDSLGGFSLSLSVYRLLYFFYIFHVSEFSLCIYPSPFLCLLISLSVCMNFCLFLSIPFNLK